MTAKGPPPPRIGSRPRAVEKSRGRLPWPRYGGPPPSQDGDRRPPRPRVAGKFFWVGDEKLHIRGVTYGTFRPRDECEFPEPPMVERDFAAMADSSINAVRTYTAPPRWLLDAAERHGLRVLVGLPAERYIGYLADGKREAPDMNGLVASWLEESAGHPAVLGYSIGNEIPASIARWHGSRRVSSYLERVYRVVKALDPEAPVTYANYPSTEYLSLPFLDFLCFNVFLESQGKMDAYLARLQSLAGERPLLMGEIGLDAYRNGDRAQSRSLEWQIRTCFEAGCAGLFVYSWTDEWYRGGADVDDWSFGLTRGNREPKPALATVRTAFTGPVFGDDVTWPRISVGVCTYNGASTLDETLTALDRLDYPDYEVILVDDGSTDGSAEIGRSHRCRVVSTPNRGLSHARNVVLAESTGSVVAYIDDDAYPDPHWLRYVARSFLDSEHAAVGGPNLTPPGDGWLAQCIANSPGNPVHVLISDREAEHLPGCNMAFRRDALEAVGGFNPSFRVAGDDVDVCWRLSDSGHTLGFSPAAVVWHHRRGSVRAYLRQQRGYGEAEGMLERRWPWRHDPTGSIYWSGRIYGRGFVNALGLRQGRIYQGVWGTAPFQSLYEPPQTGWLAQAQSPLWYLLMLAFGGLTLLGLSWRPLGLAGLPLGLMALATLTQAVKGGIQASFHGAPKGTLKRLGLGLVTTSLHLAQPAARLWGRLWYTVRHRPERVRWRLSDLVPWRTATWSEEGQPATVRIAALEEVLRGEVAVVHRGGSFDRWDLEGRNRSPGAARILVGVEEHGLGNQLVRVSVWPRVTPGELVVALTLAGLAFGAALAAAPVAAGALGYVATLMTGRVVVGVGGAMSGARRALERVGLAGS